MCKNSSSNDSGWLLYGENNWAMQFRKGWFDYNHYMQFPFRIPELFGFFFFFFNENKLSFLIKYTAWSIFFSF
jgi:hypothetical protein